MLKQSPGMHMTNGTNKQAGEQLVDGLGNGNILRNKPARHVRRVLLHILGDLESHTTACGPILLGS